MKEYKTGKDWAIIIYVSAVLITALSVKILMDSFSKENISSGTSWLLISIAVALIILMLYGVIDTYKSRLRIYADKIVSVNAFSNNELKFSDIRGYTENDNYIFIEPNKSSQKRIKISKYTGGYSEISFWLSQTFEDLEKQDAIKEKQEILNNENYGWTEEARKEKLKKARQTSRILNWAGGITGCWIFFYPVPYQYSILAAISVPVVAVCVVKIFSGLIRYDERKGSPYPTVVYAFIYPSLALASRGVLDFNIFSYSNVWFTTIAITILFLILLITNQREFTFKNGADYINVAALALFIFAYSFGTVIHINCYYDNSKAEGFTAKVIDKRISSGKTTTRYLKLSSWGPQQVQDEVSVGKDLYTKTEIGDEVNISFRKGKLGIPWFTVAGE